MELTGATNYNCLQPLFITSVVIRNGILFYTTVVCKPWFMRVVRRRAEKEFDLAFCKRSP